MGCDSRPAPTMGLGRSDEFSAHAQGQSLRVSDGRPPMGSWSPEKCAALKLTRPTTHYTTTHWTRAV
eukprot:scaffold160180_cov36-Tisochrysis_lutea.AAC.3